MTLPALAAAANLHVPTLIIVGEVVQLRDKLRWFEEHREQVRFRSPANRRAKVGAGDTAPTVWRPATA